MRHRAPLAIAALAAALAAPGAAALAAPAWGPALAIAPAGTSPGPPAAALGAGGEALGAWAAAAGRRSPRRVVVTVRHGFRAPWSAPRAVSPALPAGVVAPVAAMNARGDAVVAWRTPGGAVRTAARAGRRGAWVRLGVPGAGAAGPTAFVAARAAVGADGGAAVAWAALEPAGWTVRVATRAAGGGPWRAGAPLVLEPGAGAPAVGVAPDGAAAAAWVAPGGAVRGALRAGGAWGPAATLTPAGGAPDVAVAADGGAAAVWRDDAAGGAALATAAPGAAAWSPAGPLAPAAVVPRVAAGRGGGVLVAWAAPGAAATLRAAVRPPGAAAFGAVLTRQGSDGFDAVRLADGAVALDGAGRALVAWTDPRGTRDAVLNLEAGTAAGWEPPAAVPTGGVIPAPSLAQASSGTALVLAQIPERGTVVAISRDALPPVRLATRVRGVWRPRAGTVRWTVRVRNAGRIAARGVRVRVRVCCGGRPVSARPAPRRAGRTLTWSLGRLAPGAARTVVVAIRPGARQGRLLSLSAETRAVAAPPVAATGTVRRR